MKKMLFLFVAGITLAAVGYGQDNNVRLDTVDNYNDWGWKALVIDNEYIQLVVMPEIGGRILHYGFEDDTYMAVNSSQINKTYNPATNQTGPWTSWGYGGYKAWPSPQAVWTPSTWPPPPYLDWGQYSWSVEHASDDSVILYMISPVEVYRTPGLVQARRIKVYKNTTRVVVEQILKNVSSPRNEWSVWEVTQAIVDHDATHDYANISNYFPSSESDIKVLMGSKIPTTEVAENVRKWNYAGNGWKLGTLLKEGWTCFVDERDEQTYAKIFDIDPDNEEYPDQNSNFMLYVGGNYVEIEVQGPLTNIAQGDSTSYTENWYAAKINGNILTASHAGAVRERLSYNSQSLSVKGEYGIFASGNLQLKYYSDQGQEIGVGDPVQVNASEKLTLETALTLPEGTDMIKLFAYDMDSKLICILDSCQTSGSTGIANNKNRELSCRIYPSLVKKGEGFTLDLPSGASGPIIIRIHSLADGKLAGEYAMADKPSDHQISTAALVPGIYLITVQQAQRVYREKITVL
jgi:hypothetical protein